jgi:hypothetical protein
MADDEMVALSERLIPLLKEYDLPKVIEALSWHLMGAVNQRVRPLLLTASCT